MHPEQRKLKQTLSRSLQSLKYERIENDDGSRRTPALYAARLYPETTARLQQVADTLSRHPCELWLERMEATITAYNTMFGGFEEGATPALAYRAVYDGADSCLLFEGTAALNELRTLGAHLPGYRATTPRSR